MTLGRGWSVASLPHGSTQSGWQWLSVPLWLCGDDTHYSKWRLFEVCVSYVLWLEPCCMQMDRQVLA